MLKKQILQTTCKVAKVTFLVCLFLMGASMFLFAQDSTSVSEINGIVGYFSGFPLGAKIFTVIAIVSETLGMIPEKYVPANGVLHLLYLWIRAISWPKKS